MNLEQARFNMVEQQVRPWDVLDPRVLAVMESTPREWFVPETHHHLAYAEMEIPIGHGEAMMCPTLEGRLLQALDIRPSDRILEIGTGSGYLTALMAQLGNAVESLEVHGEFTERAGQALDRLGQDNVLLRTCDVIRDWRGGESFYDVIAVTGSMTDYLDIFEKRLAIGGRLFVVVGRAPAMTAQLILRSSDSDFTRQKLFETCLKPLLGSEPRPSFVF